MRKSIINPMDVKTAKRFDRKIKRLKAWKDCKDMLLFLFLLNALINNLKQVDLAIFYEATPVVVVYQTNSTAPEKEQSEISGRPQDSLVAEFSAYTASEAETDSNPTIMASGKTVAEGTLACPAKYKFGTKIEIEGMGTYTCEDRMAERFRNGEYFDVYMSDYNSAIQFGRRELNYKVI